MLGPMIINFHRFNIIKYRSSLTEVSRSRLKVAMAWNSFPDDNLRSLGLRSLVVQFGAI